MNAPILVKKHKKAFRINDSIIKGMAMITLDHNMANHRILSDDEALASDWKKVQSDILKVWKEASVG